MSDRNADDGAGVQANQTEASELRECPFCGSDALPLIGEEMPCIECTVCHTEMYADTWGAVEAAWNARALEAELADALEATQQCPEDQSCTEFDCHGCPVDDKREAALRRAGRAGQ